MYIVGDPEAETARRSYCPINFFFYIAGRLGTKVKQNWKNLLACVCLSLAYFACSIGYSIIAPFFPKEVSMW